MARFEETTSPAPLPPPPQPPISAPLAAAVSRVAVAQICQFAGYHAAEPSALRALSDVSARYLLALARAATSAAGAAGRTDANLLDVALALEELSLPRGFSGAADPGGRLLRTSAGPLRGLMDFVASVDEIPFVRPVRPGRPPGEPPEPKQSFSQLRREAPFPHVPRWLPGFPDTWEDGQARRPGQKGVEEEEVQLPRSPSDGKWTVEMERKRKLLPIERARVRFRLGQGVVKGAAGGEGVAQKKRKVELTSALGKALWKEGLELCNHLDCGREWRLELGIGGRSLIEQGWEAGKKNSLSEVIRLVDGQCL